MSDTELINWLESRQGSALVSDDNRHWAVSSSGFQNVPINPPCNIQTTFFIERDEWKPTIREAILAAIEHEKAEELEENT